MGEHGHLSAAVIRKCVENSRRRPSPPHPSTLSSAHPGSVAGLLFRKTMRRVLGKGRFDPSARAGFWAFVANW